MTDTVLVGIGPVFEVDTRGEVPEEDECRKKMKKRKVGLKKTQVAELSEFRDRWVAVGMWSLWKPGVYLA
jgi:hypothetical protein